MSEKLRNNEYYKPTGATIFAKRRKERGGDGNRGKNIDISKE